MPGPLRGRAFFIRSGTISVMNNIDSQITFCSVSDLERTSRFWGERMGLELVLDLSLIHI